MLLGQTVELGPLHIYSGKQVSGVVIYERFNFSTLSAKVSDMPAEVDRRSVAYGCVGEDF